MGGKMKLGAIAFWLVCAVAQSFGQAPEIQTQCREFHEPDWSYCVTKTKGSKNPDLLYYLHGKEKELEAKTWSEDKEYYTARVREEWGKLNYDPPTVVSISFGPVWLLAEKNSDDNPSGLYEKVVKQIMPLIENSLKFKGKRVLLGESMGGLNGSELVLKSPALFKRAAILCPPMVKISPFSATLESDVQHYITETGADPARVGQMVFISQAFLKKDKDWENFSPLILGETKLGKNTPPLYLSCGRSDEYGIFKGVQSFEELAKSKGVNVEWVPLDGGHCVVDVPSVSKFLAEK
jgi:Putative esterase